MKTKKPKAVSAGVIILSEDKKQIFMGHATNCGNRWDIPKGHVEEGETVLEAAIRECKEETNFKVKEGDLKDLGLFKYSSNKDLHLFLYTGDNLPNPLETVCTAMFKSPWGTVYPEFDRFIWVDLERIKEFTGKSMGNVLFELKDTF